MDEIGKFIRKYITILQIFTKKPIILLIGF